MRSLIHCCLGKSISSIVYECVSADVVNEDAKLMRCFILSSVIFLDLPYFSTLSHKGHDFRKNVIEHKMCILFSLQMLSPVFLILRRSQRDIIIIVHRSSCKEPVIFVRFLRSRVSKYTQIWSSMKIRPRVSRIVPWEQKDRQAWWS